MTDMQTNEKKPMYDGLGSMPMEIGLDVMMEILPDVALILNDPEADKLAKETKGEKIKDLDAGDAFNALIPLFARKYKPQFLRIVAACQGCSVDDIRAQTLRKTITVFASSLRVMTDFFGCCLHMARNM